MHSSGETGKKRDKLTITDNCASGKQHSGKGENNESDQASRWSQKAWCVCWGGNKNKNQVTAALVGTQCLRDGKDTTPVLVKKCQTRH